MNMEGHDNLNISNSGGAGGATRWNPTKKQIDMLENLYNQGLRTPNADQIQQITLRLRSFGHIEGKNVFYWFQNHKARLRQKQKQDHVSYVNRFVHRPPAYSACPNVLCSPFYMPYPEMGLCQPQQQLKVLLPRSFKRRPTSAERLEKNKPCGRALFDLGNQACEPIFHPIKPSDRDCTNMNIQPTHNNRETLELFPMRQQSGNLLQPASTTSPNFPVCSSSIGNCAAFSSSPFATECIVDQGASENPTFFDFFCGNGSCDSL